MRTRVVAEAVRRLCFSAHKMAFVSGPRQCGKTTLAKMLLAGRGTGRYWNWDDVEFRRIWVKHPADIVAPPGRTPVIVLDEIHKAAAWKRTLKGVYDTLTKPADILVTGSARLNVYKKGGDSLAGRYFHFRLHPFSIREMEQPAAADPNDLIDSIFSASRRVRKHNSRVFDAMMKFGPFPEPLLAQSEKAARIWRRNRLETVVREDIRDLTRIPELSKIEMLASLLPERVASPLGVASLREDLEVSFDTVKRWLTCLKELYYAFEIKPWRKSIARSIRKEGKMYLWDFGEVTANAPARFENLVACHLLKACHYWTDTGEGDFELWYLRNKEKQEIDFLITRNGVPWLPVEAKWADTEPSPNWRRFLPFLPVTGGLQLVAKPGVWNIHSIEGRRLLVATAADVLPYFV